MTRTIPPSMRESRGPICAVITESTVDAARSAIRRAAGVADLIEMRLDYLRDFDFADLTSLLTLLKDKPLPVIITCRALSEGGIQKVDDEIRLRLLVEGARAAADYCDIEAAYYDAAAKLSPDLTRLIVSYHNFTETPYDLNGVYDRITVLPAAIHKIVTRANGIGDSLAVFRLLDRARIDGRNIIALAMQEPGSMTRIIGPSRGCFLTYASLERGRESAQGQPGCEELRDVFRIHKLTRDTVITGIVGRPVTHSASPLMHNLAYKALGLDFVYLAFEVDNVGEFFRRFVQPGTREIDWRLRGLSVTIPYKTSTASFLDEIDATAEEVGAVNTVVIGDGLVKGYNTDVEGAIGPLESILPLGDQSCGVIGAGGAARAVTYGLVRKGAHVKIFARDVSKARGLAESFGVPVAPLDSLQSSDVQIVINATPAGMHGHSEQETPVPRRALRNRLVAYDLIYNPLETRFLKDARGEGCQVISGIEMLIAQAALQFKLWTGEQAPLDLMRRAALEKLST
ncbi:MAG TPA: shikimate dehydrogenase [Blastocatellia bacterium]|jgi:3-dehydroquinate dehydratase/shikimate dehydrogenase